MFNIPNIFIFEALFGLLLIFIFHKTSKKFPLLKDNFHHKRIQFFDFLKGIAIIAVVAIHASDIVPSANFVKLALWFALPLFIVESGYLLSIRHDKKINEKEFLKHAFFRVFLIYIILITIISFIDGALPQNLLKDIIYGGRYNSYYFVPVFLQFYLIFPIIIKIRHHLKNPLVMGGILLFSLFFHVTNSYLQLPNWNSNPLSLIFFGRFLFYFALGILLANFDIRKIHEKTLVLFFTIFVFGSVLISIHAGKAYPTYFYPMAIIIFILALHNMPTSQLHKKYNIIRLLGINSLIIYLTQAKFMYGILNPILNKITAPDILTYFSIIILTLFSCLGISIVFMKIYKKILRKIKIS